MYLLLWDFIWMTINKGYQNILLRLGTDSQTARTRTANGSHQSPQQLAPWFPTAWTMYPYISISANESVTTWSIITEGSDQNPQGLWPEYPMTLTRISNGSDQNIEWLWPEYPTSRTLIPNTSDQNPLWLRPEFPIACIIIPNDFQQKTKYLTVWSRIHNGS